MLTLLTATGCRPEAWAKCEQMALRQTYDGPVHWIIVDDGEEAQPVTFKRDKWSLSIIRPNPKWKPGNNTQARNLKEGLRLVKPTDKLVIWEDDDAYHPQWLERVDEWLNKAELVGEAPARYYNIQTKQAKKLNNRQHASLCCTAMMGFAIESFKKELKPNVQFIDINLWKNYKGKKALYPTQLVTGIKGLPGRNGIGMGHKKEFSGILDADGAILKEWLGSNINLYV